MPDPALKLRSARTSLDRFVLLLDLWHDGRHLAHTLPSRQIASLAIPPPFFGSFASQPDQALLQLPFLALVESHRRRRCRRCRVGHAALVGNIGSELIMSQLYKLIPLGASCEV